MTSKTDLKAIQEFVQEKCGGLTLQHILAAFNSKKRWHWVKFENNSVRVSYLTDYKGGQNCLTWILFNNPAALEDPATLEDQGASLIIEIASLLGYKERGES